MEKMPTLPSKIKSSDQETWQRFISLVDWNSNLHYFPIREPLAKTLDLHGITLQKAWQLTIDFIEQHKIQKTKNIIIITGKSGAIASEFPTWMKLNLQVKRIEPILDRNQEVGSFRVWLN